MLNALSLILPEQLRYRYFVKLSPDRLHLVPGVLVQGNRPRHGSWLEIGKINQPLARRYFVKLSKNRQLVPGSLIEAEIHPSGPWKEVRQMPAEEEPEEE